MVDYTKWDKMKFNSSDEDESESDKEDIPSCSSSLSSNIKCNTFNFDELKEALTDKSSWWSSLKVKERYEWFVDCYRMRMDDDCVWGGGNLHGLYEPDPFDGQKTTVLKDFLIYIKLAVKKEVIPVSQCFSFAECLREASILLPYAFEKSDAKEKWGGENVFSSRPSLRRTAEFVYGTSCMSDSYQNKTDGDLYRSIEQAVEKGVKKRFEYSSKELFKDVGGFDVWQKLFRSLKFVSM